MAGEDIMHFKEFSLRQESCGMRIGTDGVLLGSWASLALETSSSSSPLNPTKTQHSSQASSANISSPTTIIDVGTGTGLLTLMLAQRYPSTLLTGVEIEEGASLTARNNVLSSPFSERISIIHDDFAQYALTLPDHSIDLIVSNPPFFPSGVTTRSQEREQARHTETLSARQLFPWAFRLLRPMGRLALITPFDQLDALRIEATAVGLTPHRLTAVVTVEGKAPKRLLSEWKRSNKEDTFCPITTLSLRTKEGEYTPEYTALTAPFYIFL